MVLQSDSKASIWGKADPGEKISVFTSWNRRYEKTVAHTDGKWKISVTTGKVSTGEYMIIKGSNSIRINNVLIGEVWLCTGQSNMEFPTCRNPKIKWHTGMIGEEEEMKDADYPEIRLFHVSHRLSPEKEQFDCEGKWVVCSPQNVSDFSAVGFVFGRKLYKELKKPVGLIQSTWGGTHAESWTPMDVMENDTLYNDIIQQFALKNIKREKDYCKVPSTLWNGMLAPIAGYTIKGNIWYQGESNSVRFAKYKDVFSNMINAWRQKWGDNDMPFYFVQIAPHYKQPAEIREAQLKVWRDSKIDNLGMVVAVDAGDSTDIHPRNKKVVGERLAAWALAKQYGKKIAYSGPVYKGMKIKDNVVIISFDYTDGGLSTLDGDKVKGFFISSVDGRFYPAEVDIDGTELHLRSTYVKSPIAVRYGWGTFFRINLCNGAGFPAVPFRTDNFEQEKMSRKFADSEMRRFPEAWQSDHGKRLFFGYAQGVECCAMLDMWKATGDKRYFDYVKEWGDTIINENGDIYKYDMCTYNLDFVNPGKVLFELYHETKNEKYKKAMDLLVKQLSRHPRTLEGAFWHKLIYQHQIWLDGLYMASPFLARYGAEFNRPDLIDDAVKQFVICQKHTYDVTTGLYRHAWDESKKQKWANPITGQSPNFWGRSIGWWFMALVDALDYIPSEHPQYNDMISWIQGLAETLPKYQDKNGLWYQVLDQPTREGNFPEASVTSQFMYAYAKAVNKGYIDKKYRSIAEKAYKGLNGKLMRENSDGTLTLTNCCQVGGLGGNPYRDGSFEYYVGEKIRDNDAKATGPYIMGCLQLGF